MKVENCAQETFTSDYWTAKFNFENSRETNYTPYQAKKESQTFADGVCLHYDDTDNTNYVKACVAKTAEKAYPGEACEVDADCKTGNFTDKICSGIASGRLALKTETVRLDLIAISIQIRLVLHS